ncbi:hypothetical protein ACKKBG_A12285 [Auxenochlorella protothecoides x Auxenochlorella symbiontica]
MKVKTLQIVWHGKEPVYSVDFSGAACLATAGADKEIKLWQVSQGEDGYATIQHTASLTGHSKTVNCIRFSPTGRDLVSSGDGGEMLIWQPCADAQAPRGNLSAEEEEPCMKRAAVLRGHTDDIMDVGWSSDGSALVSASIDNRAIVWDMGDRKRGAMLAQLAHHKHFVQGVAWDPVRQFVVTQSADRTCRVYRLKPPAVGKKARAKAAAATAAATAKDLYCCATLSKGATRGGVKVPLFHDESLPSFFRRLAWSPDGSMLAVPAGVHRFEEGGKEGHAVHVYARDEWDAPLLHLPGHSKPVVAVRFCPVLFKKPEPSGREDVGGQAIDLPYRMVFAVATLDSVVIYDTASPTPLCLLGALHYDSITDLAWSGDARYLAVSSRDCYCSIAVFEPGELGEALAGGEAERWLGGVGKPAPGPQPADAAVALPDSAVQLDQLDSVLPPGPAPAQGPEQEHARPAACPTPVLKKARRIVPEAVPCQPQPAPTVAAADQSSADDSFTFPAPPSAPPSEPPTACDPLQAARCPAQPAKRRLVPTPVQPLTGSAQARFSAACQASSNMPPQAALPVDATSGGASRRRITPIPIAHVPLFPGSMGTDSASQASARKT